MSRLNVSAERSGKKTGGPPVISKKGNGALRYALYQAAIISSLNYKEFIIYHTNKIRGREREKGINTKMRVKLAAKLLIIAWTLMKKKEVFNPRLLNRPDKAA